MAQSPSFLCLPPRALLRRVVFNFATYYGKACAKAWHDPQVIAEKRVMNLRAAASTFIREKSVSGYAATVSR